MDLEKEYENRKVNVRSLFWPGMLEVLHNELSNLDFGVVALQEIWLESGIKKFDNLTHCGLVTQICVFCVFALQL
jgi:nicotinamidase-related amidase